MSLATLDSRRGKWIVAACVFGSMMAFVDGTAVNVALPSIGEEFGGGISGLQWVAEAYLLTLSGLILLGGSLGDIYGRKRVFIFGVAGFAVFSTICGIVPSLSALIGARALQGVAAAMLMPGSLAILTATFEGGDRGRAIGLWTGFSGVAAVIGPFLGGLLVDLATWRLVFLINLPIAALAIAITMKHVPESRDDEEGRHPDLVGAALAALGLAGIIFALIEGPVRGWSDGSVVATGVGGVVAFIAFFIVETQRSDPMLHLAFFKVRAFAGANLATFAVYGALSAALFFIVLQLQTSLDYGATLAGSSMMPITAMLFVLSPTFGRLSGTYGPRLFMTVGPLVAAAGLWWYGGVVPGATYLGAVVPPTLVFGLGLAITVAPLTSTALGALESRHAGIASAVNNAVARVAGLVAVAVVPLVIGLGGGMIDDLTPSTYRKAMVVCALICAAGGLIAAGMIRNEQSSPS